MLWRMVVQVDVMGLAQFVVLSLVAQAFVALSSVAVALVVMALARL